MEKYKLRVFAKWAESERVSDDALGVAIAELENGLFGSSLGSALYKKRIALSGRGKSSGARTILIFKRHEFVVFLYGYSKNEKSTLLRHELEALRVFAKRFVKLSQTERKQRVKNGSLVEICESVYEE